MESFLFCVKLYIFVLLLALYCPFNSIQPPMDLRPLNFSQATSKSSSDFGKIVSKTPYLVLRPQTPEQISILLSIASSSTSYNKLTVAARGNGHSVHGQAQALDGIVVEMDALPSSIKIHHHKVNDGLFPYADIGGGALWIELLEQSLKFGLAPRSWTDYLYLSVGGTLSNAGISGHTFKYGPQISNVLQLDVVTGTGDLVTCSPLKNSELFYAVLGGLGQFGIISTRARIILQEAPKKVKWVRALYDDFDTFTKDQELLISMPEMIDYVEGFIVLNEHSIHSPSVYFPHHDFILELKKNSSKVYYCIELAVHDYQYRETNVDHVVDIILKMMSYMPSLVYSIDTSYYNFLNRVRMEELNLREKGLWDVPHPWLNLFVPKSKVNKFKDLLLENISPKDFVGHVLMYPILGDKWNTNSSAMLPESDSEEQVVYNVGILRTATLCSHATDCLENILHSHRLIAETAAQSHIGAKQYLAHHTTRTQWKAHFGSKWDRFIANKAQFDPLCILAPGQGIFTRSDYSLGVIDKTNL